MSCTPCYYKRQRLKAKLDATKERAINWAKEHGLSEVLVVQVYDEDEGDYFAFGHGLSEGSRPVELISVG